MNALADASLEPAQRKLLVHIAEAWLRTGEWPQWGYIQHTFDRIDLDAEDLLRSLPRVGAHTVFAASYGYTTAIPHHLGENDPIHLTIAASLVVEQVMEAIGIPFTKALQKMVRAYLQAEPSHPGETPRPLMNSSDLRRVYSRHDHHQRIYPDPFIRALPDLLSYEPAIAARNKARSEDGEWQLEITRSVLLFRDVRHIADYVDKTCETVTATAAQYASDTGRTGSLLVPTSDSQFGSFDETGLWDPTPVPTPAPPADTRPPYLDAELLADLEDAAQNTQWKIGKLLALCHELNSNHAAQNPYACVALVRAITDHIPPIFGHKDFAQVAANHSFSMQRTDKAHAKYLAEFKDIAHDALHRPIGPSVHIHTMDDVPAPTRLRAVLHELVTLMRKAPTATT
ncbi:hypothetical protein [Streptomyces hydrogenans]|uniref:hypothetical protein n=1 Tax=Streptomyces hydrogenans TaxID=1873719 RepID=UPI003430F6D2